MNRYISGLLFIFFFYSCSDCVKTSDVQSYKEFKEVITVVGKIDKYKGKDKAYAYLDSLYKTTENKTLASYLEIKKLKFSRFKKSNEIHLEAIDFLKSKENSPSFSDEDNFYKFLVYRALYDILFVYNDGGQFTRRNEAFDYLLEAVSFLKPNEAIYSNDIALNYRQTGYTARKYFNEYDQAAKFNKMAGDIAFKYGHYGIVTNKIFAENFDRFKKGEYEEVKDTTRFAIGLHNQNSILDTKNLALLYSQLYEAHSELNEFDSLQYIHNEFANIRKTFPLSQKDYLEYLYNVVEINAGIKYFENIQSIFDTLSLYSHSEFNKYRIEKTKADYHKHTGDIDKRISHTIMALEGFKRITNPTDGYMLKMTVDLKEIINLLVTEKNDYQRANRLRKELLKIDAKRYAMLESQSEIYKKQVQYFAQSQIDTANEITKLQKTKSNIFLALFILVSLFLIFLGYVYSLLNKTKNIINSQKTELEIVTNSVPIGLCRIDTGMNVSWANNSLKKLYGIEGKKMIGLNFKDILHPSIIHNFQNELNSNKELIRYEGAMNANFEPVPKFEEGLKWFKILFIPMRRYQGDVLNYIVFIGDYTYEKLAELRLMDQNKEIESNLKNKLTLLANNLRMLQEAADFVKKSIIITPECKEQLLKILADKSNKRIIDDIDFQFIKTEEEYYQKLTKRHPSLTSKNLRLCSYIRMNLSSKEIASLTFSAPESVKVARSRLRKKLEIKCSKTKLVAYLNNI